MSARHRWGTREYQHIASAEHYDNCLRVRFEDGSSVAVDTARLVPPEVQSADWRRMTLTPYEIAVPTADGELEIAWSTIRALTDREYSAHLAAAAAEQARPVGRRLRQLRQSRKLSCQEVAERAGISARRLARIERGDPEVARRCSRFWSRWAALCGT